MIDLTTILEIVAVMAGIGISADVITVYLIKSSAAAANTSIQQEQSVATNALLATSTTAIQSINSTAETAINAILATSGLHDVYSIAKEKVKTQEQAQAQSQAK
ncbi:pyramid forming protein [Sulfolobus polyhedral virus 3]|nr:pyramid forming protein [Sulfolobus polyhedral virus 3]